MLATLVAFGALPTAPASAGASTTKVPATVDIEWRERLKKFTGLVESEVFQGYDEPGCVRLRQVVIKRKQPGADRTVNRDLTSRSGRYWVINPLRWKRGRYYAKVVRKILTDPVTTDTITCEAATSSVIRVR